MMAGRRCRLTPMSDINARMPPSPSLSMLMATATYLSEVTRNKVQITNDKMPRMRSGVASPPNKSKAVLSV